MLIRFVVSNFMSFKDETEFNMLPIKGNGSTKLKTHISETSSGISVLKTAAIYGANAAGKSNLINAIAYLKDIIINEENTLMPRSKRFRIDSSYKTKPTTFRLEYEYKGIHFDYAIEISKGKITEEWLYKINSVKSNKEELLYMRKNNDVEFGVFFNKSKDLDYLKKFLKKELKNNQSVLDACYGVLDDVEILDLIFLAFCRLTIVKPSSKSFVYSESILTGNKSTDFAKTLLANSKTGIEDLVVKEIDVDVFFSYSDEDFKKEMIDDLETALENREDKSVDVVLTFPFNSQINVLKKKKENYVVRILKTKHFNSEELFDLDEESDGTNRLYELSPAFEQLIHEDDVVYIVDELERSMHPLLAKELLRLFSTSKAKKSQLIFTTHESHLLDDELLRRDEIWFTEKKSDGSTEFYPLSNFNPRGDKILERGYLEGRYGGIPFLGDFSKLSNEI
ncbi:AAA family ATPase [Flavobacterium soyae]|uniref:AAA family ATPase n=1 Tax=Flavobacterium soyae TaxID=2903098 RepID=UPI001E52E4EC|nr:ATP-binding protein [Flavobacterium soyae]MCD9574864.1 ATP-binding protein [Flavobacterium soyae]